MYKPKPSFQNEVVGNITFEQIFRQLELDYEQWTNTVLETILIYMIIDLFPAKIITLLMLYSYCKQFPVFKIVGLNQDNS